MAVPSAHLPDDDWASVNTDAHLQGVKVRAATVRERSVCRLLTRATLIHVHRGRGDRFLYGCNNFQSRAHRPLGVIFVSDGIAEVHEQSIAEILGNMSGIWHDNRGPGLWLGPDP